MARFLKALLLSAGLVCALPQAAQAGGLFYSGSGTKALGRGAAFHVGVDNGLALLYNPSKLADLPGTQFLADFNLAVMDACADLGATREQQGRFREDGSVWREAEGRYIDDWDQAAGETGADITRFGALPPGTQDEQLKSWAGSIYPEVCAEHDKLPIPNLVLSHNFVQGRGRRGLRGLTIAAGMVVPGAVAGPKWGGPDGTISAGGARPDVVCTPNADELANGVNTCVARDADGRPTQYCDPEVDFQGGTLPGGGVNTVGCPGDLQYYCDPSKYDCDLLPSPTRYLVVEASPIAIPITIGVGYRPFKWLTVGAAFTYQYMQFNATAFGPESEKYTPELDSYVENSITDPFVPIVTGGFVVTPVPGFDIGGYFRWSDDIEGPTEVKLTTGYYTQQPQDRKENYPGEGRREPIVNDLGVDEGLITIAPMPWEVGGGFRYVMARSEEAQQNQMRDALRDVIFDVEFNYVYERNSQVDRFELSSRQNPFNSYLGRDANGNVQTAQLSFLPKMPIDRFWKDQHVFRLGGDVVVWPGKMALRAGVNFETRGVDPGFQSLDAFPAQRLGFHGGMTWRILENSSMFGLLPDYTMELSLAYGHLSQKDVIVLPDTAVTGQTDADGQPIPAGDRSQLQANSPQPTTFTTNAGIYRVSFDVFSLGFRYVF